MFMCKECKHKKVCKNREEFEKSLEVCEDFENARSHEMYGNIYDMFQPIFDWMQKYYPSGEMFFIVDNRSAKMYHDYKLSAYDKALQKPIEDILRGNGEKDENGTKN